MLILAVALLKDRGSAEDAVQDVFVKFAGMVHEIELKGSLKAYLATCVLNRARSFLRVKARRPGMVDIEDVTVGSDSKGPACKVVLNEELEHLSNALGRLPFEQREVVVLRMHGDMTFREIGEVVKISANTAKGRYRYGIEKLRSILK
jgi:RNA polymerase sigma-70 factor (ECF subfamily)